jgi:alkylation response protein AidB-like acyl-CoA dehydrogenase
MLVASFSRTLVSSSGDERCAHGNADGPYFKSLADDEQKKHWLPGIISGEIILALAMTEPGAGSDLAGIRTSAVRDGDGWIING